MMTNRQIRRAMARDHLGFSMIDVLVAIVVLATGLLALAALEGAVVRNGADARSRAQLAAYSQGLMDEMRSSGYDAFGSVTTVTPSSSACTASPQTFAQKMACDAYNAQTYAGVNNVSTTITSTEYYGSTGGTWVTTKPTTYTTLPHFKQVNVTTTWTDAVGQSRTLAFDTTVSPVTVTPSDNSLVTASFTTTASSSPIIREANPANTLGVIPIAISGTSNAAATNPKPVVSNTGTTFSQYTYNRTASSYGGNVITQRVDTKVIQCSCKYGGAVTSNSNLTTILAQPYQPTYWDGYQYASPAQTTATSSTTGIDSSATQDTDCDICCRDRNDSSTSTRLFDHFTTITSGTSTAPDYSHYAYQNGTLTAVTSGTYQQACRMVRVDGLYSTATDTHNYFFGLLATDTCANQGSAAAPTNCTSALDASDTIPSTTTENSYASFVKDYLYNNVDSLDSTGKPQIPTWDSASPQTSSSSSAALYIGSGYQLNTPTNITIAVPNSVSRWQYARGLYIDYIEPEAQKVIANAKTNCPASDEASVNNCTLPYVPFTTINMTELGNWSSTDGNVVTVSDTAVIGGDETSPKRGKVTVPSTQSGTGNPSANIESATYLTNSSLTAVTSQQANSPYDISHTVYDSRQFSLTGNNAGGGNGSAVYFDVSLTGLSWMSTISNVSLDPSVSWNGTATQLGTAASGSSVGALSGSSGSYSVLYVGSITTSGHGSNQTTTLLPNDVATSVTPAGLNLNVQYFNNYDNAGSASLTCTASSSNGSPGSISVNNATRCFNYQVDASNITINGAAVSGASVSLMSGTNDGGMQEGAVITLPSTPGISSTTNTTAGADSVSIPFTLQSTTTLPGTCSCTNNNCNNYNYTPGTCSN